MAGDDLPSDIPPRVDTPPAVDAPPSDLSWHCLPFAQVPSTLLYQVLALRSRVFVVEQRCLYEDIDGADLDSLLLAATVQRTGQVVATARILPARSRFAEPSIGRVCLDLAWRGRGLGRRLMEFAIGCLNEHHPGLPIRISAQAYLKPFYASLGFEAVSDTYLEDGIPHVEMLRATRQPGTSR